MSGNSLKMPIRNAPDSLKPFSVLDAAQSQTAILPRPRTPQQRSGLRYERQCLSALLQGDFTENLRCMFKNTNSENKQEIINFSLFHNPNISYLLENQKIRKICIPDILLKIDFLPYAANQTAAKLYAANAAKPYTAKSNPANSPANPFPANYAANQSPENPANSNPANLNQISFLILIEIKLTYVETAFQKLNQLYIPVVKKLFKDKLPIFPLIIVKNLTHDAPKSAANLTQSLLLPIPLLHFPRLNKSDTIY